MRCGCKVSEQMSQKDCTSGILRPERCPLMRAEEGETAVLVFALSGISGSSC